MKVTLLLADAAQAIEGKLYILGGGWSVTGPVVGPMAIAMKIEVPWDKANQSHNLKLVLLTQDGQPVKVPTHTGDRPVELESEFEVGRPPGMKPGTPLDLVLAINLGPLPLAPDSYYVWRCFIDDQTADDWRLAFSTRPLPPPGPRGESVT